jgi:hypothetical protein
MGNGKTVWCKADGEKKMDWTWGNKACGAIVHIAKKIKNFT